MLTSTLKGSGCPKLARTAPQVVETSPLRNSISSKADCTYGSSSSSVRTSPSNHRPAQTPRSRSIFKSSAQRAYSRRPSPFVFSYAQVPGYPGRSLRGPRVSVQFHQYGECRPSRLLPPGTRKKEGLRSAIASMRSMRRPFSRFL